MLASLLSLVLHHDVCPSRPLRVPSCSSHTSWNQPGVRAVARSLTNKEGEPLTFTTTKGVSMLTADVTVPSSLPAVING